MCTLWRLPHDCRLPLQVSERRYTGRRGGRVKGEGEEQCVRPCVLKFATLAMVGGCKRPEAVWLAREAGVCVGTCCCCCCSLTAASPDARTHSPSSSSSTITSPHAFTRQEPSKDAVFLYKLSFRICIFSSK